MTTGVHFDSRSCKNSLYAISLTGWGEWRGGGGGRSVTRKAMTYICLINPLILNPSSAEATFTNAQGREYFWKTSIPWYVGIHWKALSEYCQMSTHVPGLR